MDRSVFRHTFQIRVRNYEVDWQGIVHNSNYLLYCEIARMEYLKQLGLTIDFRSINGPSRVVLVRNEIEYKSSAVFDDLMKVYTRVSFIRNSSFAMEGLIVKAETDEVISTNVAFHVWLDSATKNPVAVPNEFRGLIRNFEGPNCQILEAS